MKIGLCREIKSNEGRVALTPGDLNLLVDDGHEVYFEKGCGNLSGYSDEEYVNAGAMLVKKHDEMFKKAKMIVRVKEIEATEYDLIQDNQIIVAYFHLTASREETELLLSKKATCIDYEYFKETITNKRIVTMSPVAGRLGVILGTQFLYSTYGGKGLLPMGVPGAEKAEIGIVGSGDAGMGAIKTAIGLGANVTILHNQARVLEHLENQFGNTASYLISSRTNILETLKKCDVFVNCIYWDKLRTDHLVYRKDLKLMKKSSIIIDISCDINGGIETCKATTHSNPTYIVDNVIHYCVDNIPAVVPYTASKYLSAQSFPLIQKIANNPKVIHESEIIRNATLMHKGFITHPLIAKKWNMKLKNL